MAVGKFLAPLNGRIGIQQPQPYVDDIFDPLFNAEVRAYYDKLYGPLSIPAGYAAMLDNALTGRKGILGPGMGILSTFGRSMDKADDFILGGLTEGVNALGQVTGGNNAAPTNPIENIFVNDYDYQGTKLMAAMGNAMARLTGTQTPLTERDFQTLGDKVAGTTLDLATDPGIMGGQLSRLNGGKLSKEYQVLKNLDKRTPVGQIGDILNDYDNLMANVAGNMAFPGGKALIGKGLTRIRDFLGGASSASPEDLVTKHTRTPIIDSDFGITSYSDLGPDTLDTLRKMSDDYTIDINPIDDPELYAIKEDIDSMTGYLNPSELAKYQQDLADFNTAQAERLAAKNEAVKRLQDTANKQREDIIKSSFEGMEKHSTDFQKGSIEGIDANPDVEVWKPGDYWPTTKKLNDLDEQELLDYVKDNFADYDQTDWYGNPLEYGKFYEDVKYRLENDGIDEARNLVLNKISPTVRKLSKSNFVFAPNRMGFQSGIAKDSLDVINYHIEDFLRKHPNGLYNTYLRKELGVKYIPNNVFEVLAKYSKGQLADKNVINGKRFQELLDSLYSRKLGLEDEFSGTAQEISDASHSFIPWVRENAAVLQQTDLGQDLISLADNLERDVFDNNLYEMASKNLSSENISYDSVINPAKEMNKYFSKETLTPEELAQYAEDFPYLDLKVSEDYIKNSQQYKDFIAERQKLLDAKVIAVTEGYTETAKELDARIKALKRAPTDLEQQLEQYYTPAKQNYWKKLRGSPYAYDYTSITPTNIYDAAKNALVAPNPKDYSKISEGLATFNPDDFAKEVTNNFSFQDNVATATYEQVFDKFKMDWDLPTDMDYYSLEPYIKTFGTRDEKTLFQQWTAAFQSKITNKLKTRHGVYSLDSVKRTKTLFDSIADSKKYNNKMGEYISRNDLIEGAKISGDNFLESIYASGCFKEIPIDPKYTSDAQVDEIIKQLNKNVGIINKNGNILKVIDIPADKNFPRIISVAFDTDNLNVKKDINKIYGLFGKKNLELQDVMMRNPTITEASWDTSELDSAFKELRNTSEELSKTLGYTKFSPNYISHAMEDSEDSAEIFNAIYKRLGLNKTKLDQLHDALLQQDIASSSRLSLGALPVERAHLGYFGQYSKIVNGKTIYGFSTDLKKIHASTFTQGMFDNTNVQTFFDLFLSDNFKINQNFDSVDTLKKALNLSEGNINNLSLVKPKYNEYGKLIGFTKYNKHSDIALNNAFNDPEAILVPDTVIGSLDRMCKKDARMSNKVYRIINKYLTVPVKFGILANPGFLAGNIQDAYFKQATELSKKYGTTLSEELTNVAFSMRQVTQLNNNFSDIFDEYKQWLKDTNLKAISRSDRPADWYLKTFKKSKNVVDTLTIDQIVGNPEMYSAFKQYLNTHVPLEQQKMANLYLFLNNNQTTTMFKNNNRDLEDLANMVTDNPYAVPNNIFERIMYGDPSKTKVVKINGTFREVQDKGFNSYGLFLNNPVSNGILKSSNTIENWMRSSTILNDLQHQGYTMEDICDILGSDKVAEKALRDKFKMSMNEALNTMYAANFDYDNVSEFMNKMSYILPFPTFYLKNLAFWADIFTNKPQLIDNVISTHEGLWAGKDTSKDEFTAEAKGRGAVPIGQQNKHLTGIVKQTPYNSMFGAFNAVNDIKEDFAYRTNPILRPIARHLQDPKDIKYRPYNTQQYQKNITQADPQFSELAYLFHQLNPYERFINTGLRTPGKVANNSYQLSDFLPSMFQPDFSKKSR